MEEWTIFIGLNGFKYHYILNDVYTEIFGNEIWRFIIFASLIKVFFYIYMYFLIKMVGVSEYENLEAELSTLLYLVPS